MTPRGGGSCARLSAAGLVLALLTALPAAPPLGAQTTTADDKCVPTVAGSATQFVYSEPLTYSGAYTTAPGQTGSGAKYAIRCDDIDDPSGVKLTLSGTIGTEAAPVGGTGIGISTAAAAADGAITIINNGEIHADATRSNDGRGINGYIKNKAGTGGLTVSNNGSIVSEGTGINLIQEGKGPVTVDTAEGSEIEVKSLGSGLASGLNIRRGISITVGESNSDEITGAVKVDHKGGISVTGPTNRSGAGIYVQSYGVGPVTVTTGSGSEITSERNAGIEINAENEGAANTGTVTVTHGGRIIAGEAGMWLTHEGAGDIVVETKAGSSIVTGRTVATGSAERTGLYAIVESTGTGDVRITHGGRISSATTAVAAWNDGTGGVTVTSAAGSSIAAARHGIYAEASSATGKGDVRITHGGRITAGGDGIGAVNRGTGGVAVMTGTGGMITAESYGISAGILNAESGSGVTVTHGGTVDSQDAGILAYIRGVTIRKQGSESLRDAEAAGMIKVTVGEGGVITSAKDGVDVWHNGSGGFDVAVLGKVTGGVNDADGSGGHAGVRIRQLADIAAKAAGGMIVVGPGGYAGSGAGVSGVAVKVDSYSGPVKVVLQEDGEGFTGHIEGRILNPGKDGRSTLTFHTRAGEAGALTALTPGTGTVKRRGAVKGVYTPVHRSRLETITGGYQFKDIGEAERIYSPRARLYEALPSALLGLTAGSGSGTVTRGGSGGWAKVFMSDGERTAGSSTTGAGRHGHALGWGMKRQGLEIGYDFPADEALRIGFSAGQRSVKAAVAHGGDIKAKATGGALTLGWRPLDGGFHVDGHLSYSRLHGIELSPMGGMVIKAAGGSGVSVGVSAGTETEFQGMKVTPRAGLEWSSVKTGGFTEPAAFEGAGEVSEITAQGLKGTLGARIDMEAGESGTFWVSADAEHDLKDETSVTVPGAVLKAEMKPTWGRLGFGGEFRLSDMMTVSGRAFYAMAGGGNKDLGGSLALNVSF